MHAVLARCQGRSASSGSPASRCDLMDLRRTRLEHQIPVNLFVDEGAGPNPSLALTHNAFWLEPLGDGFMRGYFMTETDNQADLLVYQATPWINC